MSAAFRSSPKRFQTMQRKLIAACLPAAACTQGTRSAGEREHGHGLFERHGGVEHGALEHDLLGSVVHGIDLRAAGEMRGAEERKLLPLIRVLEAVRQDAIPDTDVDSSQDATLTVEDPREDDGSFDSFPWTPISLRGSGWSSTTTASRALEAFWARSENSDPAEPSEDTHGMPHPQPFFRREDLGCGDLGAWASPAHSGDASNAVPLEGHGFEELPADEFLAGGLYSNDAGLEDPSNVLGESLGPGDEGFWDFEIDEEQEGADSLDFDFDHIWNADAVEEEGLNFGSTEEFSSGSPFDLPRSDLPGSDLPGSDLPGSAGGSWSMGDSPSGEGEAQWPSPEAPDYLSPLASFYAELGREEVPPEPSPPDDPQQSEPQDFSEEGFDSIDLDSIDLDALFPEEAAAGGAHEVPPITREEIDSLDWKRFLDRLAEEG